MTSEAESTLSPPPDPSDEEDIGISAFASRPVLRLVDDGRLTPFSEIFLYSGESLVLQRELTVFELTSVAEGMIAAAARMLKNCHEQIVPKQGWALPISNITQNLQLARDAIDELQEQLRQFTTT